jgi:hypothetical protein
MGEKWIGEGIGFVGKGSLGMEEILESEKREVITVNI